jgi:alpha-L-fucosidase
MSHAPGTGIGSGGRKRVGNAAGDRHEAGKRRLGWRLWPLLLAALPLTALRAPAQTDETTYVRPQEPAVRASLARWQGYKFGLLVHMGLYSELGTVESWGLCPEDWVTRPGFDDYCQYAANYRGTKARFNPVNFEPARWAQAFKGSGARYVITSTKHHDGFCLFDTKYTDFKVTDPGCPFSSDPRADVTREVFAACRKEGLAVGAYFSKPDWTSPDFWWPAYPPKDRNPNYDITKHPDRWRRFIEYTHGQIAELTENYGPLDILWLDGCWVMPKSAVTEKVAEFCKYPYDLDIDMKTIAERARRANPGLLVVDRWVQGQYENYLTPEQKVPGQPLAVPWESCLTMGNAWGWVPNDHYKPGRELIHLLVRIVAKGGNLLLGIGPNGKGEFEPAVYDRLERLGRWLAANGEAIYGTRPVAPYEEGPIAYTAKGAKTIYAIYLTKEGEASLPRDLDIRIGLEGRLRVTELATATPLRYTRAGDGIRVILPAALRTGLAAREAVAIRITSDR